jgi:FkbM family methyltransferase
MMFRRGQFEREYWLVPLFCDRQHRAIDVGANLGEYSYYMALYAREVVSFEPNSDLRKHFRKLLGHQSQLEAVALSNSTGTTAFRYVDNNTGVATIEERNNLGMISDHSVVKFRSVETRTLDSYEFSDISFMKIDVEGHEEAVLDGAKATLKRCKPIILVESENRHNPGAPARVAATLGKKGYAGFYIKGGELIPIEMITEVERDWEKPFESKAEYVNNYIFIPESRADLVVLIRSSLDR